MNKIYKVIWSKAKHTYVVASEIAKGHTKGETTGKGLKKLAAAMLVAAALLSPSFAWAADATTKFEPAADQKSTTAVAVYTKDEADSTFATQDQLQKDVSATNELLTKKADQTALDETNANLAKKADQTALDETNTNLAKKADQTALDATNANLAKKADQTALDETNANLAKKANQVDLDGKADKATTLEGYGITNAYTKTEADSKFATVDQLQADVAATNEELAKKADKATTLDGYGITDAYTKTEVDNKVDGEKTDREAADKALDSRTSALEAKTGSLNRVAAANSTSINESMTLKDKQYSATLQVNGSGAQIGVVNNSAAGLANDGGTAYTEYRARTGAILSKATNDISSTSSNGQVVDTAGDTAGEYSQVATAKSTGTTFTYKDGTTSSSTTIKGDSVSTGTVSATAGITDGTTTDGTSVKASQTVGQNLNALDERITNVKEYVLSETNNNYVSKTDAAVQDGAVVKAANTIGDNVTKLDAALAKETAARLGADAAQDKVIQQVNQNMVDGFNTINKNMSDGFTALNNADLKEAQERAVADAAETAGRVAADTKLVEAVNGGLSLGNGNVLQTNKTSVKADGTVSTSKEAATTLMMNEGKDNQITLSENGIKVGKNSGVMDKDGFYAGGDNADAAAAALKADGSIKGAKGNFTVDGTTGDVNTKGSVTAASGTVGNVSMSADGTVTGVKDLTASGKVTAGSFTDGTATMSNGSLNGVNQINATGNIVTTGNMKAHDITAEGTIKGETINGTTGTFGSLTTTSNASVGGKLTANGITNTGNVITDTLTVNHNATVGGDLGVTGDITGKSLNVGTGDIKGGQITGTGLDVGAGTIKTTGAVETGTLKTTGNADIGGALSVAGDAEIKGDLTVDEDLKVNGTFDAKTLSSTVDANNYTTINGGKTESRNLKMDAKTLEIQASASTFDETGSQVLARDDDSKGLSTVTADSVKQLISDVGDNAKNYASRELSQNTDNKYEITDSVVEGNQSNVENRTADTTDSQISLKDDSGKVLNKSYITQNLKKVLMGVEEGGNKTTIEQDANNITNTAKNGTIKNDADKVLNQGTTSVISQIGDGTAVKSVMNADGITNNADGGTITNDAGKLVNTASDTIANMAGNDITNTSTNGNIANTAANGTISNNAKNLTNTASENITNKAENGNISNIASNGTISNEAKTISNKADEALTNDAKTITNTASESVTTQIGNGSEVQSVMNASGIANKAAGKSITNDAATITNTGTISVTNQVGKNKVLVDTTHVQSAFGDTIYTTWNESGITDKVGENVERTMGTSKITESVKNGTKSNTFTKTVDKDINIVTDGTNTSTESQLAGSVNTSLKNGTQSLNNKMTLANEDGKAEDVTKITDTASGAFSSSSQKADSITNTVKDGTNTSEVKQTASEVATSAKNITNTAETIKDVAGKTTVTTTDTGTTFENTAHSTAIEEGTITSTTISGNTLETGKATMDYADVMKDLGVRGNASVGKDLTVAGTSTLTGDVTMENNATVRKNLTVEGKTNLKNTKVDGTLNVTGKSTLNGGLDVTGGTTDKLHVTSSSQFDGAATFKDIVTMEKDLNVGGNVDAASYKVDGKTYIDKDGINANNKVIRNVGQGDISEGSTDAVSGGQLYDTNTRVSGLETRMGTVETRVDKLDNKIDKVGANAAAMANLHPLEFDEDSKWNIAAAVGSSGSETASAVGVFYRPNENVMVNASAAMGTGENMFGGGVSLRLGHGGNKRHR